MKATAQQKRPLSASGNINPKLFDGVITGGRYNKEHY
jgi:hypothetical protein